MKRRFFIKGIMFSAAMVTALGAMPLWAGAPTAAEYGVVLNLSGKQRMLTQKMSKEVMLVALGVDAQTNLGNLKKTAALFDKTLKGLKDGDADLGLPPTESRRIKRQLGKVAKIWKGFHATVESVVGSGQVSKDQVAQIAKENLPLLKQMNKCVKLYEKDASKAGLKSDPGLAVTINLAGKQRMLTQKMSKEYLLAAYGHAVEDNKLNLLETYSLFERTLKGLMDGDATLDLPGTQNAAIRAQLEVVAGLWATFKPVVVEGADPKTSSYPADKVNTLATTNLPLLKQMNRAVGMFAKEAAK
uniref:NarX-like N-terminal domain-containing protein n=1 Tax=Magnetococcus massalia (strain MO-1) TaxID=451514 RepID=A0A1S7LES4_MAGMO|nr:conserved exported protein of unknown function [Candidatus Magnetococcus massalia]